MTAIKKIEDRCISIIAAGEKISDIEIAVRELIDNSVDAGATNIEVKLVRFGIESIEIEDNGCGIDFDDLKFMGQRYYTSKVRDIKNFACDSSTFGFRGEALACLSNISQLTIITKSQSSPTGTRVTFNRNGTPKMEPVARDNGTTVIVKNLFHSLPVRKKELESTAKRQYDKVVRVIYEHILVRPHIRFTLSKSFKMKKEKDFTHGGGTLEKAITSIFGSKMMDSLISIKQGSVIRDEPENQVTTQGTQPPEEQQSKQTEKSHDKTTESEEQDSNQFYTRRRTKRSTFQIQYNIDGYVSKSGQGRHSTDGQFLFVNKKPCDIPKVSKLINDLYRNCSLSQSPFYCLFIEVQHWAVDFNVPRKRNVILTDENKLCNMIKQIFDSILSSISMNQLAIPSSCPSAEVVSIVGSQQIQKSRQSKLDEFSDRGVKRSQNDEDHNYFKPNKRTAISLGSPCNSPIPLPDKIQQDEISEQSFNNKSLDNPSYLKALTIPDKTKDDDDLKSTDDKSGFTWAICLVDEPESEKNTSGQFEDEDYYEPSPERITELLAIDYYKCRFTQEKSIESEEIMVKLDFVEDLKDVLNRERAQRLCVSDSKEYSFAIHPNFSKLSEEQLIINLSREAFLNMDLVGQFNRGFIITKFNDHLFIIDQHASHERFNFEDQLDKCPFEDQPMVRPKPLLLTLIQENVVMNNLEEFYRRGLKFMIDTNKTAGFRVQLNSIAVCKGHGVDVHLDKEDVEELINVIVNSPSLVADYTLEKVKNLAASKACRKSVMIGDALTRPKMKEIVNGMNGLRNPWICAHGRPTIRHLMDVQWMYRLKKRPDWMKL